jgi:maltose O-acetyltransferase
VLPGVTIGARAVIGAGSVVTRDVPADVFAAGNPCRVIRPIEPESEYPLVHEKAAGHVDQRAMDIGGRIGSEKDDD